MAIKIGIVTKANYYTDDALYSKFNERFGYNFPDIAADIFYPSVMNDLCLVNGLGSQIWQGSPRKKKSK